MAGKAAVSGGSMTGDLERGRSQIHEQLVNPIETAVVYGGGVHGGYLHHSRPLTRPLEPAEDIVAIAGMAADVWRLEHMVREAMRRVEALAKSRQEEIPEIFELPPASKRRIKAKIRRRYEPARFRFIEGAEEVDLRDTRE